MGCQESETLHERRHLLQISQQSEAFFARDLAEALDVIVQVSQLACMSAQRLLRSRVDGSC